MPCWVGPCHVFKGSPAGFKMALSLQVLFAPPPFLPGSRCVQSKDGPLGSKPLSQSPGYFPFTASAEALPRRLCPDRSGLVPLSSRGSQAIAGLPWRWWLEGGVGRAVPAHTLVATRDSGGPYSHCGAPACRQGWEETGLGWAGQGIFL